jgi:hypothetical protein
VVTVGVVTVGVVTVGVVTVGVVTVGVVTVGVVTVGVDELVSLVEVEVLLLVVDELVLLVGVVPDPLQSVPPAPPSATSRLRPTQLSWRGLFKPLTTTAASARPLLSSRLWADATAALPSKRPNAPAATSVLRMPPPSVTRSGRRPPESSPVWRP